MRTLKGFLYLILGGTLCGWMFNRISAWFIDNPLTVGSNHTVAEWAVILQDRSTSTPHDAVLPGLRPCAGGHENTTGPASEEQKKLRGEGGNQRWRETTRCSSSRTPRREARSIRIPQRTMTRCASPATTRRTSSRPSSA
ncbi:MAG: hypothetical protein ACLTMP_07800 [Eggerthella lenta]